MSIHDLVTGHYGGNARTSLATRILDALTEHGVAVQNLTVEDLAQVDELHAGGPAATKELLTRLPLSEGQRLLDVGCGIGGPSRLAASQLGVEVTGVDITQEFIETASALTQRVGLDDRVGFTCVPGGPLPLADGSFDAAMMIHVGMNVPDKRALFTEVHRVLGPGARFALFEQMRSRPGALPYPMPWAMDERLSFVETSDQYGQHLTAAGFTVEVVEDRTAQLGPPSGGPGGLSPAVIFGPDFARRIANNVKATEDGLLAATLVVARV